MRHHNLSVAFQLLSMERRLNHRAPPPMAIALRGQETVPEQPSGTLQSVRFDELVVTRHQHRFGKVRVLQEKCRPPGERERHDVAGRFSEALQKSERITCGSTTKAPQ